MPKRRASEDHQATNMAPVWSLISCPKKRVDTFKRRLKGFKSLCNQITTLCGTKVLFLCTGAPNGDLESWPNDKSKINSLIQDYTRLSSEVRQRLRVDPSTLLGHPQTSTSLHTGSFPVPHDLPPKDFTDNTSLIETAIVHDALPFDNPSPTEPTTLSEVSSAFPSSSESSQQIQDGFSPSWESFMTQDTGMTSNQCCLPIDIAPPDISLLQTSSASPSSPESFQKILHDGFPRPSDSFLPPELIIDLGMTSEHAFSDFSVLEASSACPSSSEIFQQLQDGFSPSSESFYFDFSDIVEDQPTMCPDYLCYDVDKADVFVF
ncbi:uncharacterized protein [Aristolochia californica]|uniref:uncharacterized protein n=1 Tax=Aristolochia californica TaxID=171875 RepID=UPI0035DD3550